MNLLQSCFSGSWQEKKYCFLGQILIYPRRKKKLTKQKRRNKRSSEIHWRIATPMIDPIVFVFVMLIAKNPPEIGGLSCLISTSYLQAVSIVASFFPSYTVSK